MNPATSSAFNTLHNNNNQPQTVQAADNANAVQSVSVNPVLPNDHLVPGDTTGFFNLLVKPGEKFEVKFKVYNNASVEKTVKINVNPATTSNSGTSDYSGEKKAHKSMQYNMKDYVKVPSSLKMKPKSEAMVTAVVNAPEGKIDGVMVGGFHITTSGKSDTKVEKSNFMIRNKIAYVLGIRMQNSKNANDSVKPDIKFGDKADVKLNRGIPEIFLNAANVKPTIMKNVEIDAYLTKKGSSEKLFTHNSNNVKIMPNSDLDWKLPTDAKVKSGDYTYHMTVINLDSGQKWTTDKPLHISIMKAYNINKDSATVNHEKDNQPWIIGAVIALLAIAGIVFFIARKKKKQREEDED